MKKMEEKGSGSVMMWYRLRGLGLITLCLLVFSAGAYMTGQESVPASSRPEELKYPICSGSGGKSEEKLAALTFDTTGTSQNLDTVLKILGAYDAKATFFVTEQWAEAYPDEIKRILQYGHELGSLGWDRVCMSELTGAECRESITGVGERVKKLTGAELRLFRPLYGDYDEKVLDAAGQCGYLPVLWSIDSMDWKNYGADDMLRMITESSQLQSGAVIRLHTEAACTAPGLEAVVERLQEMGYQLVTVSRLLE